MPTFAAEKALHSDASSDDEPAVSNLDDPSQVCFLLHNGTSKTLQGSTPTIEQSPQKITSSKKRKRKQELPQYLASCSSDEPRDWGVWRMEAFQVTWKIMEESVQEIFEAFNTKVFKEVQKFIHNALFYDAQLELYLSPETNNSGTRIANARASKQLHAALLYLRNVDTSDHTKTFTQLKHFLRKNDFHVANLLPHNFSSKAGVGASLHNVIKQIVGITPETTDMDILASWHRDTSNMKSPIVIILEDAELCNPMVLAEFIVILSEWIAVLPLVLLIGMATSGETIQKLLPASAARHLHVHSFTFPSPDEYLEQIIMEVLLDPTASFTLGCDALIYLLSQYQMYDNTVTFFIRALKMACMEHFLSQPLSFLCCKLSDDPIETNMDEKLLEHVTMLPSAQGKQFDQDVVTGKEVTAASTKFREQKIKLSITIQCLLGASSLLGTGFLKIFQETLEHQSGRTNQNLIMTGLGQSNGTTILLKRLRDAPDAMVHKVLTKWIQLAESWKEMRAQVQELLCKIASELSSMEGPANGCRGSFRGKQLLLSIEKLPEEKQESLAGAGRNISGGKDLFGESPPPRENEMDDVNTSRMVGMSLPQKKQSQRLHGKMAANLLEQMMGEHLKPLESLLLHEIFCYRDVAIIKQALVGVPRKAIQQNVEYPTMTLQCHCCPVNASDPSDSMNDSSILFRLAQKQGEEANLFELYQAFDDVLQHGTTKKESSRKGHKSPKKVVQQEVDRTLVQARFCKAAAELQHVGLFRMSSKKRAEYVRLAM